MRLRNWIWLVSAVVMGGSAGATPPPPPVPAPHVGTPAPVLVFAGQDTYQVGNRRFVRYWLDVLNKWQYPSSLFSAAPQLPPCGANANSSRTWVDIFAQTGARIYGFCALNDTAHLGMIWFGLPEGQAPPAQVYVQMKDRQTDTIYRSNLVRIEATR